MPNCTIIKTGATITGAASERVRQMKKLINNIPVPVTNPHYAGEAVLYDTINKTMVFVSADADFANDYPATQFTPIGVVAVPNSHQKYGSQCGVISLKYMSCSTPDEGSTSTSTMAWGYNNLLLGKAYNTCVATGTTRTPTEEASGDNGAYLPSDSFTSTACPTDPEAFYNSSSTSNNAAPSPYLEDGSPNPVYYQTTDPTSDTNCLSDFNGDDNTQLMLDNVTVSDWRTAETITNAYTEGNYPAACCCWRYHTEGTSQGDWYLPACGELGYMMVRLKTINNTITNLISAYGEDIGAIISTSSSYYYWSSTEYSYSQARYVSPNSGYVTPDGYKSSNTSVRAFLRV